MSKAPIELTSDGELKEPVTINIVNSISVHKLLSIIHHLLLYAARKLFWQTIVGCFYIGGMLIAMIGLDERLGIFILVHLLLGFIYLALVSDQQHRQDTIFKEKEKHRIFRAQQNSAQPANLTEDVFFVDHEHRYWVHGHDASFICYYSEGAVYGLWATRVGWIFLLGLIYGFSNTLYFSQTVILYLSILCFLIVIYLICKDITRLIKGFDFKRVYRLKHHGQLLLGKVIDCDGISRNGNWFINLKFKFVTPDGFEIIDSATHLRNDLRSQSLPESGKQIYVLYVDKDYFKPM